MGFCYMQGQNVTFTGEDRPSAFILVEPGERILGVITLKCNGTLFCNYIQSQCKDPK